MTTGASKKTLLVFHQQNYCTRTVVVVVQRCTCTCTRTRTAAHVNYNIHVLYGNNTLYESTKVLPEVGRANVRKYSRENSKKVKRKVVNTEPNHSSASSPLPASRHRQQSQKLPVFF